MVTWLKQETGVQTSGRLIKHEMESKGFVVYVSKPGLMLGLDDLKDKYCTLNAVSFLLPQIVYCLRYLYVSCCEQRI